MDGIALIAEAHAAGLSVYPDGDRLVVRGPKTSERVAKRLLAAKPVVMAVLTMPPICAGCSEVIDPSSTDWRPTPCDGPVHFRCWESYGTKLAHLMGHA